MSGQGRFPHGPASAAVGQAPPLLARSEELVKHAAVIDADLREIEKALCGSPPEGDGTGAMPAGSLALHIASIEALLYGISARCTRLRAQLTG